METKSSMKDLRIWPGVVIVLVQLLAVFGLSMVAPATSLQFFGMMGGPLLALVLLYGWWLFASRAAWSNRLLGAVLAPVVLGAALALADESVQMAFFVYGLTLFSCIFVLWAGLARRWPAGSRQVSMIVAIGLAAAIWPLVRVAGVDGDMRVEYAWRWSETAEERFLASAANVDAADLLPAPPVDRAPPGEASDSATATAKPARPSAGAATAVAGAADETPADDATAGADSGAVGPVDELGGAAPWPGFRGAARDGVVAGLRIATDWQASPPEEIWRRPVGPGWSSVSIAGGLLYTQEQRGDDEIVSAYRATSGEPVWLHRDPVRFWEALAGAGPRATPTYDSGRLYTLGATGILNALDAKSGARIWSRDIAADTGAPVPDWGFSASPLVDSDRVVVHAGGPEGKGVVAYDAATGLPRWFADAGALSYSSVHPARVAGVDQLIIVTDEGLRGLAPDDGAALWAHAWPAPGARIIQPAFVGDRGVLVGTGFGMGVRRIEVARGGTDAWTVEEGWTSAGLKPYYNDFVVHRGHAYGFDGRILACLDLETGERIWKGGRYGNGQVLLLADQDLLLVISDRGDVALVPADPAAFTELARMTAIEGKTWNHPVISGGVLYLRNGEEMVAFTLRLIDQVVTSVASPKISAPR